MKIWEINAEYVEAIYGSSVDLDERFYICPECNEPVYECDWTEEDLKQNLCPICGFDDQEEESEEEYESPSEER